MRKRPYVRGERHHWWPQGLLNHWLDENGAVSRLDTRGRLERLTPANAANIAGGHNIEIGDAALASTFEDMFDHPDGKFPQVVTWLQSLAENHFGRLGGDNNQPICVEHPSDHDKLALLHECMLSLSVRSPMFRSRILLGITRFNQHSTKKQYKQLVALNLRNSYHTMLERTLGQGKFMVLIAEDGEFVFGDGFYSNIYPQSSLHPPVRMLTPLTPKLAVLYELPMACLAEPKIVTKVVNAETISLVNDTVQIYSKDWIFYRTQPPVIRDYFQCGEHRVITSGDPVTNLVAQIPGIQFDMPW